MKAQNDNVVETKGLLVPIKGLVTFAKGYRIEEGGSTNEGLTINFLMTDDLTPCMSSKDGSQGYKVSKASVLTTLAPQLTHVPGYYDMMCEMSVASNGKPVLTPVDFKLINLCELNFLELPKEEGAATEPVATEGKATDGKAPEPKNNKKS